MWDPARQQLDPHIVLAQRHMRTALIGAADWDDDRRRAGADGIANLERGRVPKVSTIGGGPRGYISRPPPLARPGRGADKHRGLSERAARAGNKMTSPSGKWQRRPPPLPPKDYRIFAYTLCYLTERLQHHYIDATDPPHVARWHKKCGCELLLSVLLA